MHRSTSAHRLLSIPLFLSVAALSVACGSSDRNSGRGGTTSRRDAGTSSTAPDSGVINNNNNNSNNNNNNGTTDGGSPSDCSSNPNGCVPNQLVGAAPMCTCLAACSVGFTWNANTQMCDPVGGGSVCGNEIVEAGEECDDGNTVSGDGCSSTCQDEGQTGMACQEACDKLRMCTEMQCPGTVDVAQCLSSCEPDPQAFQVDLIDMLTCQEINDQLCPNTAGTNAGAPCTADSDCMAGSLQPFCFTALDENSQPTGWENGYCTAIGCRSDADCGADRLCVTIDQQGTTACFLGCDVASNGAGVCRMGYQCPDLSGGQDIGACLPACTSDAECATGETCNTATGQCI